MSGPLQHNRQQIPDGRIVTIKSRLPNDESSGSDTNPSPEPRHIVNLGRSLTLSEFVEHIETSARIVGNMFAPRYRVAMSVQPPQANNADRYSGRGDDLTEDVVYELAGRCRSRGGIIEFSVMFLETGYGRTTTYEYHYKAEN